jgi:hypothetical protein
VTKQLLTSKNQFPITHLIINSNSHFQTQILKSDKTTPDFKKPISYHQQLAEALWKHWRVRGNVEQELLIRNEYLAAEIRISKSKLQKPVQFGNRVGIVLLRLNLQ